MLIRQGLFMLMFASMLVLHSCAPTGLLAPCQTNADCDASKNLVCRAKKCRATLEEELPIAKIEYSPDLPNVGQFVQLDGRASSDPLKSTLQFSWSFLSSPRGSNAEIEKTAQATTSFTPDLPGDYKVQLEVIASDSRKQKTNVTIVVTTDNSNQKPIAVAGEDQQQIPKSNIQLDGSKSTDPEGTKLTYKWRFVSKPDGSKVELDDHTKQKPTFTVDLDGDYRLELIVTDKPGLQSEPDLVTIRIYEGADATPSLTKVTPSEGFAYELKLKITLEGDDFYPGEGAKIRLGQKEFPSQKITYISKQKLEATVDLALVGAGKHEIAVINPNGKVSNTLPFTIKSSPPPTLVSLTPNRGHIGGNIKVKAVGTNFLTKYSEILFQEVPLPTTVLSTTEIEFTLDLKSTIVGEYPVKVRNPGGNSSNTVIFTVSDKLPKPVLNVLNPPSATVGTKVDFSVHGTGFEEGGVIVFDGTPIKSKRIRRDEMQADPQLDLTNIKTGTYDVWVRNPDGQTSNKETFRVIDKDPKPVLSRILPFIVYIGEVNTNIAIYGQDFLQGATVTIDGKEINGAYGSITFRSDTFLIAEINLTDKAKWTLGDVDTVVKNPNQKTSDALKLTISHRVPSVTAVIPSSWTNQCDTTVEIQGSNFVPNVVVKLGTLVYKVGDPTYPLTRVSDKVLKFSLKATALQPGKLQLFVENGPKATAQAPDFVVSPNTSLTPFVQSVRPSFGKKDKQVFVAIQPDNAQKDGSKSFKVGATVELDGVRQKTTCLSYNTDFCYRLEASLDLTGLTIGSHEVIVVNPCGVKSSPITFSVEAPDKPYILSFTPQFANIGDKVKITIKGNHFTKNHTLMWGGKAVPTNHVSEQEIETQDPIDFASATLGDIEVIVKNGNGQQTDPVKFSVLGKYVPTIKEVNPNFHRFEQILGTMSIRGTGFVLTSLVYLDGKVIPSTFLSAKEIKIVSVDASGLQPGTHNLQVKNGTRASNFYPIHLGTIPPPRIHSVDPANVIDGSRPQPFRFSIYGEQFSAPPLSPAKVLITDSTGKDWSTRFTSPFLTSSYIRGTLDIVSMPVGDYFIQIENTPTEKSNKAIFRISPPPPPILTSVNPGFGFRGNPRQQIQLSGTSFSKNDLVIFNNNGLNRIPVTFVNSQTVNVTIDLSALYHEREYEIYVLRCQDPLCTKSIKTAPIKFLVKDPPCSTVKCDKDMPKVEQCDTSTQVCKPKCTTTADCTGLDSVPKWTCQSGVCK